MGAVKSFQSCSHINKKVPESFAQAPMPLEIFLHIQTWHSKYPASGYHYALELNVGYAGVTDRWDAYTDWSASIAQTDLLKMHDKTEVVSSTLRALGLDHSRLPTRCDPDYHHTVPSSEDTSSSQHAARMRAIMSGEGPPRLSSGQSQHTPTQPTAKTSGAPPPT